MHEIQAKNRFQPPNIMSPEEIKDLLYKNIEIKVKLNNKINEMVTALDNPNNWILEDESKEHFNDITVSQMVNSLEIKNVNETNQEIDDLFDPVKRKEIFDKLMENELQYHNNLEKKLNLIKEILESYS